MRFRILRGSHSDGTKTYYPNRKEADPESKTVVDKGPVGAGEIIETETDLVARFGREKFERLPDAEEVNKTATLQAENDRLKAEVEQLRAQLDGAAKPQEPRAKARA